MDKFSNEAGIPATHEKTRRVSFFISLGLLSTTALSSQALSQEVIFSEKSETAVSTSNVNSGSAADIIIQGNGGEIEISSGTAVTVDSDNTVDNNGIIENLAQSDGVGVHFDTTPGNTLTSGYTGIGRITVSEFDADDNYGTNNYGILVDGGGTLEGDIVAERNSFIAIYGDDSAGVSLQTDMVGDITVNGISIFGERSNGVEILGNLTGNIIVQDEVGVGDPGSHGVYIGADVDGGFINTGAINAGSLETRDQNFNILPGVASVASLRVSANLTGGIANNIVMTNSSGNVVNVAEGDSTAGLALSTASLRGLSGTNAILVTPEKVDGTGWTDITIGNTGSFYGDYSLMNQRDIKTEGVNDGQDVTTILITGAEDSGTIYNTTFDFGIYNGLWGTMEAEANDADATLLHIGNYASVPEFVNNGVFNVNVLVATDNEDNQTGAGGDAYGVVIDPNGELLRFENNGSFTVRAGGTGHSGYGLIDRSGTLTEFVNTGPFRVFAGQNGAATAVDLSQNTTGVTFSNSGNIFGDVYLGSGTNDIDLDGLSASEFATTRQSFIDGGLTEDEYAPLLERLVDGTIFLSGGSATLDMTGNARLTGGIVSPNGQLDVTLNDQSQLTVNTDNGMNVNNLTVNDDAIVDIDVQSIDNFTAGVNSSGTVTFAPGSRLNVRVSTIINEDETFNILTANNLIIDPGANIQNLGNNSFVYDLSTSVSGNDIDLSVRRRSAEELGLAGSFAAIYEASVPAFAIDQEMAGYLGGIETAADFNLFYKEIMPLNLSQASLQAIQNANDVSISAVSSHLDGLRHMIKNVPPSRALNGIWIQEFAGLYDHKDGTIERGADVFNFGLAAGYEFTLSDRGVLGLSLSYNIADIKFNESGADRLTTQNTQLGLYSAFWLDNFFVENQASVGYLDFSSEKDITLGDLDRMATADWNGLQYSGNMKVGYELGAGSFTITPTAAVNYTSMREDAYQEAGGGSGFNLSVAEHKRYSLTTDLKMEIAHLTEFKTDDVVDSVMRIALSGGWSQQLNDDPLEISASFEDQNNFFTLYGDPIDKNNFQAGLGVYFTSNYFSFTIRYDAEWRDRYLAHSANMNLRARF